MGFFDDIGNSVSSAWEDMTSTGAPAIVAGIESYGADQLTKLAKENQATATKAVQQIASTPGPTAGVMKNINSMFSSIGQNVALKEYGLYIIGGILVIWLIAKKA